MPLCQTRKTGTIPAANWSLVDRILSSPLYMLSCLMGSFDFSKIQPSPSFFNQHSVSSYECNFKKMHCDVEYEILIQKPGEEHRENDGVVPLFSQLHPHDCRYALRLECCQICATLSDTYHLSTMSTSRIWRSPTSAV